jgi:hypothetical protein
MALKGMSASAIARELNLRNVKYAGERPWTFYMVGRILTHKKYAGCNVWGQTSRKLHERITRNPRNEWVTKPEAFQAIIDQKTFDRVQRIRANKTENKSDAELLAGLKRLWREKGCLSEIIIDNSRRVPAVNTYYHRFGSLRNAYRLVGYSQWEEYFRRRERATQTERHHVELVERIAKTFPDSISLFRNHQRRRRLLLFEKRILVSVYLCRSIK